MSRSLYWMLASILTLPVTLATGAENSVPMNMLRALEIQIQMVEERPYDAGVHNDLGNLLALAGQSAEAETAYRRALELDPANTDASFNLAVLLQQIGQSRAAQKELERLLEKEPNHAWGHYQLGAVHAGRDNRAAAIEHYARAFALDATLSFSRVNPHIIENRLSTEALLMARQYQQVPAMQAPRLFGEPTRIADLMLRTESPLPIEDDDEPAAEAVAGSLDRASASNSGTVPGEASAKDSGGGNSARSLTPDDLETTSLGQAGATSRRTTSTSRLRRTTPSSSTSSRRSTTSSRTTPLSRSASSSSGRTTTSGTSAGALIRRESGSSTRSPAASSSQTRSRYRPSSHSTGRLELQLLPEDPAAERYARLVTEKG